MSTFPYALPQVYPVTNGLATTGTSENLTAGKLGMFDKSTHAVVTTANEQNSPYIYFALGSFYSVDRIGKVTPLLGLKESTKTPGINAKYVTRFYKTSYQAAQNQILKVGSGTRYECGKTYTLRVEAMGADVLRVLNRQMYKNIPAFTGYCPDDCATGDCTKTLVDASVVMKAWADYINADPLLSLFVKATAKNAGGAIADNYTAVTDQATVATTDAWVELEFGYVDTVFGDCSFEPIDFYQKEPIIGQVTMYRDLANASDQGPQIDSTSGVNVTEIQAPKVPKGLGETVLRHYNLSQEYRQLHYQTDNRKKEIEQGNTLTIIDRHALYTKYYLQFHVPVFTRPSNTFSNEQYLISFVFKSDADTSGFEALMNQWLAANNPAVTLQAID